MAKTVGYMVTWTTYGTWLQGDRRPIEETVRRYKNASTVALREKGLEGRVWTRGYDKRFCFDEASLEERIRYVQGHDS
jgi:hypothetical protein